MAGRGPRPDGQLAQARVGLKPFQLETVDVVVDALFREDARGRRFLVADEAGLGKTKVARAVVAETISRMWNRPDVKRINIVYICSNHQIARQNIRDLHVLGDEGRRVADRITMLPAALADMGPVNLVAFTPATSLDITSSRGGRAGERAMLHRLLSHDRLLGGTMMRRPLARQLFSLGVKQFDWELGQLDDVELAPQVARSLLKTLQARGLVAELDRLSDGRRWGRRSPDHQDVLNLVAGLRRALAEVCMGLLAPSLVILDEFQRFSRVLHGDGDDAYLAKLLMRQPGTRVLMLSATPYRVLSGAGDRESHYKGFIETIGALIDDEADERCDRLEHALSSLGAGMLEGRAPEQLRPHRDSARQVLRSVMVRTERLASTPDREGMLRRSAAPCEVTRQDVAGFIGTDQVASLLGDVPSMVEYWKSAPYLFNFMDGYKVKRELASQLAQDTGPLGDSLLGRHMLGWQQVERHRPVESMNGRLRWLQQDLTDHRAWDLLWLPPALPQTELAGSYATPGARRFTKRLVFSGWTVVPKAVAALLSYEAERRHHLRREYSRREAGSKLTVRTDGTSSALLAILLPCAALADLGDPVRFAREHDQPFPVALKSLRRAVEKRLQVALRPHLAGAAREGRPDLRWYLVAQRRLDPTLSRLHPASFAGDGASHDRGLAQHLDLLRDVKATDLGKPPDDLVQVLAEIAIAGPGVSMLRALRRLRSRFGWLEDDDELAHAAARVAWAFRSVMSTPEAESIVTASGRVRSRQGGGRPPYWRAVLQHTMDGALGSVLDEWLHLVPDQERLDGTTPDPARRVVDAVVSVLTLQASSVRVEVFERDRARVAAHNRSMRPHFPVRFGQAQGKVAEGDNPLHVRQAFNSPFWPFVLVSTSVGQEGLDFHHYSHAVVHWNLPPSPVELEQREGRVHRYKNHAVRKNVARQFGRDLSVARSDDPWTQAFDLAVPDPGQDGGGIVPWWIFPDSDGAAIERYIPMLPLSRDEGRLTDLEKATSLYRLAMGQPRQTELLSALAGHSEEHLAQLRDAVSIDLSPRGRADSEPRPRTQRSQPRN